MNAAIVIADNEDEDYAYPTVPRLPSNTNSTSNSRRPSATASLRKKTSNLSLRPGSTRARSSVEVPRTSLSSDRWGVRPAFLRNAVSSGSSRNEKKDGRKGGEGMGERMGPTWPATPPRSSEEPDVEGEVGIEAGWDGQEDEYEEFEDVDVEIPHSTSSPAFASNASFFGAIGAQRQVYGKRPEMDGMEELRTSEDSVAPPSIRTVRGAGVKRTMGRRLWR